MCKLTIYRNILALKIFVLLALLIEVVIQIISIKDHPLGFRLIVLLLIYFILALIQIILDASIIGNYSDNRYSIQRDNINETDALIKREYPFIYGLICDVKKLKNDKTLEGENLRYMLKEINLEI